MKDTTIAVEYVLSVIKDRNFKSTQIKYSGDAVQFIRQLYSDDILIYETAYLILLNSGNYVVGWVKLSQGGIGGTIIDNQLACIYMVKSLAKKAILVHNHPSGNTNPSLQDKQTTENLNKAFNLFNSYLLDSIILTEDSYYSFADNGLL